MAPNSLFAVLLRSSWWVSGAVALAVVVLSHVLLPETYAWVGASGALPFVVICVIAVWKQAHRPSARQVQDTLQAVSGMSWERFGALMAQAYERQGYQVERLQGQAADLVLQQGGRTTLVACRRWKAARTGVEPVRDLLALARKREADHCIYVSLNPVSEQAMELATREGVRLVQGADLATALKGLPPGG